MTEGLGREIDGEVRGRWGRTEWVIRQTVIRRRDGRNKGGVRWRIKERRRFHDEFCDLSPGRSTGAKYGRHRQREAGKTEGYGASRAMDQYHIHSDNLADNLPRRTHTGTTARTQHLHWIPPLKHTHSSVKSVCVCERAWQRCGVLRRGAALAEVTVVVEVTDCTGVHRKCRNPRRSFSHNTSFLFGSELVAIRRPQTNEPQLFFVVVLGVYVFLFFLINLIKKRLTVFILSHCAICFFSPLGHTVHKLLEEVHYQHSYLHQAKG